VEQVILEKKVEKTVVKWANANGWLAWKLWGFNQVGLPDRIFLLRYPTIVFMEFKRPGGKLAPLQERIGKMLAARGFPWYTVEQVENGIHILQRAMAATSVPADGGTVADK
jgi:hypothetical protein